MGLQNSRCARKYTPHVFNDMIRWCCVVPVCCFRLLDCANHCNYFACLPSHVCTHTYLHIHIHAHAHAHAHALHTLSLSYSYYIPQIWDRSTLQVLKVLKGHKNWVQCLQYNEQVVISGSRDHTVKLVHPVALST